MKRIIFAIVFIFITNANLAQYHVSIKKNDGSLVEISTSDISRMAFYPECPGTPTVSYAGKTYHTVYIGTQCWLKENLDIGTMINSTTNQTNNGTIEKYCYGNLESNCTTDGGLYQKDEAVQYNDAAGAQGICPSGWHIPTDGQFEALMTAVSNDGNALKAVGQGTGSGAGTNTSGFSALLAGNRYYYSGSFYDRGKYAYFQSSSYYTHTQSREMQLYYLNNSIEIKLVNYQNGYSVRCLKN